MENYKLLLQVINLCLSGIISGIDYYRIVDGGHNMKLEDGQEIVGTLTNVKTVDRIQELVLIIDCIIEVPISAIQLQTLQALRDRKMGIFRLGNRYFVREIR